MLGDIHVELQLGTDRAQGAHEGTAVGVERVGGRAVEIHGTAASGEAVIKNRLNG